jgi:general secretion pathway protein D
MKNISKTLLIFLILTSILFSQDINDEAELKSNLAPTLISIPANTSLSNALNNIGMLTKSKEHKVLINKLDSEKIINEEIINLHYRNALYLLADKFNYMVLENDSSYIIEEAVMEEVENAKLDDVYNSRQIKVYALLFEANTNELKKRGVNLQAIISKHGMVLGSNLSSFLTSEANPLVPDYSLNLQLEGDIGPFSGYANALFNFLESEQLGEIVARLSITVRDGEKGVMQVGSDFSIKQKDFAGNVLDAFYPTGTIIEVVPNIFQKDTLNFSLLKVNVERSFAIPNEISTQVKKTNAKSEIIMKDGDEAVIAGLLYNQFIKVRSGIPILKDLPWWVLGLRYLTGNDRFESLQKEVILLIRTEIIPSLSEQMAN